MRELVVKEVESLRNYQFEFLEQSHEALLVSAEQSELRRCLEVGSRCLRPSPWCRPAGTAELADSLLAGAACLVPFDLQEELQEPGPLRVKSNEQAIPWEWVFPDHLVVRQPVSVASRPRVLDEPLQAAGCVTHPELFPTLVREWEVLSKGWAKSEQLESGLELLTNAKAGFAFLGVGLDQKGHPCLPRSLDLKRWLPRQLNKARRVPRVLFLRLVDNLSGGLLQRADDVARELLKLGSETIIVNFWEPDPGVSPEALSRFAQVLSSATVGEAFEAMRQVFPEGDSYWSRRAFGFYGNPELRMSDLRPLEVGSNLSATTIPKMGRPDFRLRIVAGPGNGREIPIYGQALRNGQTLILGSPGAKHCHIEVEDPELADQAFELSLDGETVVLKNLCPGPDAVRVEGLPVYQPTRLEGRQTIESGGSRFVFEPAAQTAPRSSPTQVERGRFRLRLSAGPEQDRELDYALVDPSTLVGREGAFALHDRSVSRQHFIILERDGFHHASVLGQAQVILNGIPLDRETRLRHQDLLQLSDETVLQYVDSRRSP